MITIKTNQYTFWQEKPHFLLSTDTENYWVMYIIEDGACRYRIGERAGRANAGSILLCPPRVAFQREVLQPLTFHFVRFNFQFDCLDANDLAGNFAHADHRILDDCSYLRKIEYCQSADAASLRDHYIADIFYAQLYRKLFDRQFPVIHSAPIQTAIRYINEHYCEPITVKQVADLVGLNSAYFSRKFKREAGSAPIQYIERLKMRSVQQLLITTDLPISTIAAKTGFADSYYLSHKFSTYTHVSPTTFRKNHVI